MCSTYDLCSTYDKGEPSCVFCTICNELKSVNNDASRGHVYCEDCILNYVCERIKETLAQVKCPVSDCIDQILIDEYFVPPEFMDQWMDTVREAEALYSCEIIECPYMGCEGYLIDDEEGIFN